MKKLNLHQVEKELKSQDLQIFTPHDLMVVFGVNKRAARGFVSYNVEKGAFVRLKAGLYTLSGSDISDYVLANRLYFPSYISLDSALSHYSLIPESVYAVTSITSKPTREFEVIGRLFEYRRIKKEAFSGYIPQKIDGRVVYIATPEKAVADFLYFAYLGKRKYNDRLKLERIDQNRLKSYLALFSIKLITFASNLMEGGEDG